MGASPLHLAGFATFRRVLFFALLLAGGGSSFAGAAWAPGKPTVHFTVFSAQTVAGLVYTPRENAEPRPVIFYPTTRSPRYEYRGTMPLRFSDSISDTVVAEVTIPSSVTHALLLFEPLSPVSSGGLRYRIHLLDDGAARQASGSVSIVNFSGLPVSGTIGRYEVVLKEGLNTGFADWTLCKSDAPDALQRKQLSSLRRNHPA